MVHYNTIYIARDEPDTHVVAFRVMDVVSLGSGDRVAASRFG